MEGKKTPGRPREMLLDWLKKDNKVDCVRKNVCVIVSCAYPSQKNLSLKSRVRVPTAPIWLEIV